MEEDKKKPKILVVEDDPGLRRTLSDILKAKGYSSLVVLTGKEGVAVAKKDDFSLALIGLKLSDIPGIEVLKEIKKSSPRTEVIILTAFASLDTAMEAVNLGAFSYLQKPYDMERLLLDIRRALEQKWTEEALRKSEEKYFNLYENANDIIYSHDLKGRFTSANRAARTAFGYRKEEVSKLTISGVLLPDDAILARQIVQRMVALKSDLKEQQPWEFKAVRKDGSILDIEVRSRLLKENGRINGVQGIARDITERKKAEEALRESEEKYRTLITNIPDVTWTSDCNGNTIFISPNVERVYGYTPEEIYNAGNRIWFGRIHPDDIEKVKEAYAALFEKETKFDIVYRIKRKDGKWIWLHDKAVTTYVKDDVSYADGMFGDITERKRMEELLRSAEADWRDSFNSLEDVMLIIDRDYNIENINEIGLKLLGKSKEELIGKKCYQIISGADSPSEECPCMKSLKTKKVESLDRYEERFGKYFSIKSSPIFDENGEIIKFVDLRMDITERKRVEEELKNAGERYRVTFEHTGTAMAILEEDTTISLANKEFEKLSGYSKEEIEGKKSWTEFAAPGELERLRKYHYERRKKGKKAPTSYEFKGVDRKGNLMDIYINVEMIPGTKKSVISLMDITTLKRLMNELNESRKFLETVIDNIPDTVTIRDPQHRFVLINQAYCNITKHTRDEVIGEKTYYWEKDKEVFQTGKKLDLSERSFTDFKGKRHYISVKKAPLTDQSGKVAHVLTVSRDITEHKWLDDEREHVLKELKELNKLKTNFLNVAYHEMRSPLGPILASASLLEQGYLTAKQKRLVFIIERSVKQLEKLINRLLELTLIDTGKVELKLKTVSIPEIVKNVLGYLKPMADAKKQTITLDVPEGIEIEGDEQKITAIFDNLISNAIKYTEKKGKIDIKAADRGGGDIVVSIADTGIGISEGQLSHVFERFFMADTSLSRKGGLGLGLAIVKEYIKLHRGKVWATSELGKGSKFGFTLPKKQRKKI